jgi:tetratricopeptide (TPR) repeat protein
MKGTISEGAIAGILRELYVGRKSGLLHFTRGDERRSVRFHKGNIVHGDTNIKEDRLGETLVRQELLSAADLKRATGFVLRDRKRLGVVLRELGILDKDKLEDALALHSREILLKVFSWADGDYAFDEDAAETYMEPDMTLKVSTAEMILEAVRRVEDPDIVRYALGNIDRVLGLSSDPLLRFQKVTLSPADGYVLSRVDGSMSAREIIQMNPSPAEETMKSLYGLVCTGILEYLPVPPKTPPKPETRKAAPVSRSTAHGATPQPPTPGSVSPPLPVAAAHPAAASAALRTAQDAFKDQDPRRQEILEAFEGLKAKNHFEVLGIPKASNESQVKEAYFRLAKRFHPDAHHDPALADLAEKLEAVFIRLGQAYEVLRNPRSRSSYESDLASRAVRVPVTTTPSPTTPPPPDPAFEARLADESYRKAEKHFDREQYWDAIQLLEPAVQMAQGKPRNKVRVLLAKAYLKNPKWIKRAEEQLQTVLKEEAANVEAHFLLGTIYKTGGLKSRAIHAFQRVLELKPDHEQAAVQLGDLGPDPSEPPPSGGGGLLKKLFGKT